MIVRDQAGKEKENSRKVIEQVRQIGDRGVWWIVGKGRRTIKRKSGSDGWVRF